MHRAEDSLLGQCFELLNKIKEYPENKKCFDCVDTTSPRYVCLNFSTFVCSCCANVHKEFGHSIKCMNVFECTLNEILQLKATGNKAASDKWLALWTPQECPEPDTSSHSYKSDAREYFRMKYVEKKWAKKIPTPPKPGDSIARACVSAPASAAQSPMGMFQKLQEDLPTRGVRAQTYPTPPFIYHYVPHQGGMLAVPVSLPQDQYVYSRYPQPVPLDLNQVYYHVPPVPAHLSYHDPAAVYGMLSVESVASPQTPTAPITRAHTHSHTENPFMPLSPPRQHARFIRSVTDSRLNLARVMGSGGSDTSSDGVRSPEIEQGNFVRSVSANSVMFEALVEASRVENQEVVTESTQAKIVEEKEEPSITTTKKTTTTTTKTSTATSPATSPPAPPTNNKWKNSIMNKMTGLLKKSPSAKFL